MARGLEGVDEMVGNLVIFVILGPRAEDPFRKASEALTVWRDYGMDPRVRALG